MVKGLDLFREHFREYTDSYVLIGGAACDLVMSENALPFRATKDLDIVLCVEGATAEFARTLWDFIRIGEYQTRERSDGRPQLFRFSHPGRTDYPTTLEFFSREPDGLSVPEDTHLVPIQLDDSISALSAILLDTTYYEWVQASSIVLDGVVVADAEHLIPLKAHAWCNLSRAREEGEGVESRKVRKHRNDILRLSQIVDPERPLGEIPPTIANDMQHFVDDLRQNPMLGRIEGVDASDDEIIDVLIKVYGLE